MKDRTHASLQYEQGAQSDQDHVRVKMTEVLLPGEFAEAEVQVWDGTAFSDSGTKVDVYDWSPVTQASMGGRTCALIDEVVFCIYDQDRREIVPAAGEQGLLRKAVAQSAIGSGSSGYVDISASAGTSGSGSGAEASVLVIAHNVIAPDVGAGDTTYVRYFPERARWEILSSGLLMAEAELAEDTCGGGTVAVVNARLLPSCQPISIETVRNTMNHPGEAGMKVRLVNSCQSPGSGSGSGSGSGDYQSIGWDIDSIEGRIVCVAHKIVQRTWGLVYAPLQIRAEWCPDHEPTDGCCFLEFNRDCETTGVCVTGWLFDETTGCCDDDPDPTAGSGSGSGA